MVPKKSGWDVPLEIDLRFNMNLLTGAMQAGYDKSGFSGGGSGRLRRELGKLGNYKLFKKDVRIVIPLPYARIQDTGGRIPLRVARQAKFMHYFAYGEEWFMRAVRGFQMKPHHYIDAGAREIMSRFNSGKGAIQVRWKYSKAERTAFANG